MRKMASMATAAASPARRPRHAVLRAVELFHAGKHKEGTSEEQEFTDADIEEMAANFAVLSKGPRPAVQPPVAVGHESHAQQMFAADDWPADGQVVSVHAEDREIDGAKRKFLVGNLRVPNELAGWVDAGKLTRVSAEVYDGPPEGSPPGASGKCLKRVVLLGLELPQLKRLKPLPKPQYVYRDTPRQAVRVSRSRRSPGKPGRAWCFSEVQPMDRQQMEEMAVGYGFSEEFIKSLDDKQLGALIQEWQRLEAGEPDNAADPNATPAPTNASDTPPAPGGGAPKKVTVTQQYREVRAQLLTVSRRLDEQDQRAQALERQTAHRLGEERRATVDAALDRLKREGKVLAAELDPGPDNRPTLRDRLLRADSVRVHKFSEGGKSVEKTELQLQLDELEARPVLARFSERVPQGKGGAASADPAGDAFRARLKAQYDAELAKPAGRRN